MASTTPTKATARPARTRATAAKAASPAKTEETTVVVETPTVAEAATPTPATPDRTVVDMEPHPDGNTKSYTKWVWPAGSGGTGTLYAEPSATAIKVAIYK